MSALLLGIGIVILATVAVGLARILRGPADAERMMATQLLGTGGVAALLRFPEPLPRLHALTKADNLGLGLVVLGLLPRVDSLSGGLNLVLIWLLALLAGAVASQLIGGTAWRGRRD
jgi:multicomponent Na+:H+ antiporter subunit G